MHQRKSRPLRLESPTDLFGKLLSCRDRLLLWAKIHISLILAVIVFFLCSCSHLQKDKNSELFFEIIQYSDSLKNKKVLRKIYLTGDYLWLDKNKSVLVRLERVARNHGLDIRDFQFLRLALGLGSKEKIIRAETELLITDRVISLIKSLRSGYVNPNDVDPSWSRYSKASIPTTELEDLLKSRSISTLVENYGPKNPGYQRLKNRLRSELLNDRPNLELVEKIKINMERWRWLDSELGNPYVFVNIAIGQLSLISKKSGILQSKVLVGTRYRQTPAFSSNITKIVVNPTWTVPPTIFSEDLWPKIKTNDFIPADQDMKIYLRSGKNLEQIRYEQLLQIDDESREKVVLIQDPGIKNPLGKLKFYLPNPFGIYLHDTNNPKLFNEENIAVSSGCIRVQKAKELAEYLLKNFYHDEHVALNEILSGNETKEILLDSPIPVHIVYFSFWIDQNGNDFSVADLYGRDEKLQTFLKFKTKTPTP